jgi:hypothetical protein
VRITHLVSFGVVLATQGCGGRVAPAPPSPLCERNDARVCQGPNACPTDDGCRCFAQDQVAVGVCVQELPQTPCAQGDTGACVTPVEPCDDATQQYCWYAAPYDLALLLALNGAPARARYGDYSDWTGQPLPEPTTCPSISSVEICGPSCPSCPPNTFCHGRSPVHPFGVCFASNGDVCSPHYPCAPGKSCFVFTVQPDAQTLSNGAGFCLDAAECSDLAQNLPGGGACL